MNEKGAIRASAIHDLGVRFDDSLDSATARSHESRGAVAAFSAARQSMASLMQHVDRDIDEGKLSIDEATLVKLWLSRALNACEGLFRQSENRVLMCEGELRAIRHVVDITGKTFEIERATTHVRQEPGAPVDARRPSIKQRRLTEATADPAKPSGVKAKAKAKAKPKPKAKAKANKRAG